MLHKISSNASPLWAGFLKVYKWMGAGLSWLIGNGSPIYVGIDPVIGGETFYQLSACLISKLHSAGIYRLSQIRSSQGSESYWLSAQELDLAEDLASEWHS